MQQTVKQQEWIIYLTTNLINKKIYVGQMKLKGTSKDKTYKGSGTILKKAFKKWGIENFHRETLVYSYSQMEADIEEIYWIDKLEARDKNKGYNLTLGGMGGSGQYKAVRCINTGVIYESLEEVCRLFEADKSTLSKACRGKVCTVKGFSWEYVDSPNPLKVLIPRKKVICLNNNMIFEGVKEAAEFAGCSSSNVIAICRGRLASAKGYSFKYLDLDFEPKKNEKWVKVLCVNDDMKFNSISEAVKYYKISERVISNSIKGKNTKCKLKFEKLTD